MKLYYFFGPNPKNKSGVSWKLWKVERKGRELTVWWGSATIDDRRRYPVAFEGRWGKAIKNCPVALEERCPKSLLGDAAHSSTIRSSRGLLRMTRSCQSPCC
jgi:hypothetical protein